MENSQKQRNKARKARVMRVRKKIRGTAERPRLTVHKTNKHLYAQLIDDVKGVTLKGIDTLSSAFQASEGKTRRDAANYIGTQLAKVAKELKINQAVFDRGRWQYHGIVRDIADAARAAGLTF